MGSELNIEVSEAELHYRIKNFHELRVLRQRELSCASCGNVLSHESEEIFLHPIFGILQCRKCNDRVKDALDSHDTTVSCHICATPRENSYTCNKKDCSYKFCQACIKRNAPKSLAEAESKRWKCFACNLKPLWKLRGCCAGVMSSTPKRTKRKKVSRNSSSDREDLKSDLKNISYVRRRRLTEANELRKRLSTVCDAESPIDNTETVRPFFQRNKTEKKPDQVVTRKERDKNFDRGNVTSRQSAIVTSSEDSDIEEIKTIRAKVISKSKSKRDNLTETRKKGVTESRKDSRKEKINVAKLSRKTRESRNKVQMSSGKLSASNFDSSSDDSDVEEQIRAMPTALRKRKSKAEEKSSEARKILSIDDDSDDDASFTRKKSRKLSINDEPSSRGKSVKSTRDAVKKKVKILESNDDDNSDSDSPRETRNSSKKSIVNRTSKQNGGTRKSTRVHDKTRKSRRDDDRSMRKSIRDKSPTISNEDSEESTTTTTKKTIRATKNRQLRNNDESTTVDENLRMEGKSGKSFDHRRIKNQRAASDSSSGKEFLNSKLFRGNLTSLNRISELEQDYTRTPDESPEKSKDLITKDQTFALKNSVTNFFAELKRAANILVRDIENAQTTYFTKDSMLPKDVDSLIIKTKNVVDNLKKCVDNGENKMDDYYGKWCKRTRVKNVLKNRRETNEHETSPSSPKVRSKKSSKKIIESENESNDVTRGGSPLRRNSDTESPIDTAIVANGAPKRTSVSDCNSEEIFSGDEARTVVRNDDDDAAAAASTDGGSTIAESPEPKNDKSTRSNNNISSDETIDETTVPKNVDVPIMVNDEQIDLPKDKPEDEKEKDDDTARRLSDESILSKKLRTSMESVDPSDVDIFETSVESLDNEANDCKTLDNSNERKSSDNEEKSLTKESSRDKRKKTKRNDKDSSVSNSEAESMGKKSSLAESRRKEKKSLIESESDEKCSEKNIARNAEGSGEISSDTESTIDLPIDGNSRKNLLKIANNDISKKNLTGTDASLINNDSKSSENNCQNNRDTEEIGSTRSSLRAETSGGEIELNEQDVTTQEYIDNEKNNSNNVGSINSLDTVVEDGDEDKIVNVTKRGSSIDDTERRSSLDTISSENNDNDGVKSGSISTSHGIIERKSSVDTVLVDNNEHDVEKNSSNSSFSNDNERRSSSNEEFFDDNNDQESVQKSRESNDNERRSSMDTVFADDIDRQSNVSPSKLRSNVSRTSTSSNPSETDNLRARDMLLFSSNSDESSADDSPRLRNSAIMENEDTPPTPPESDSNSRKSTKTKDNTNEPENDSSDKQQQQQQQQLQKTRRNKFCIENNPHLMANKQLNLPCEVSLNRLEKKILDRHSRALKKSREYLDCKKLKRIVSLDRLDKKKKVAKNSDSEDDDTTTSKDLRNRKKTQAIKEREDTLLDHLERIKNGQVAELSNESEEDNSDKEREGKNKPDDQSEDSLFAEADRMAKKRLLESSDSAEEEPSASEPQDKEDEAKEEKTKKTKKVEKKEKLNKSSEDEEKKKDKAAKSSWRKNKVLTCKISDSDTDGEKKKFDLSQEKLSDKQKNEGSQSDSEEEKSPKKKRLRRRVLHSDSDVKVSSQSESESSEDSIKQKKKKKKAGSSDGEGKKKIRKRLRRGERSSGSSDSMDEKRPKNRRKRIKTAESDSDSDLDNSQGTPGKSGRKNIRKVIRDKQVADDTKQAAKDEEERLLRIAERQKLYNQMYETRLAGEEKVEKLVLDFDEETKEPLVSVDEGLVKRLKPHQAQGIKFMWDACFESLERTKTTKGSGCILAHCMGLGKTFQIVALSHTLLQHRDTGIKTIMVVCPLSTVLNWVNEFKIWLEDLPDGDDIEVYELTKMKKNFERKYQLQRWQKTGGVMVIGYEMFRNLSTTGKKVRKNIQDVFSKCLVDPGPDLIVCDEGHLLKNEDTALSKAMRRVKTLRRIVLTGTPLQNNLIEYHCMVQFVKPNLLGTKKEFTNRFENPITNGQFDDSTEYDVRLMKKRAHVLHKMLEGSVQRLDYSVLTPFLPPKQEYVIFVKLTEVQINMYRHYLDNYARRHRGVGGSLFADFQALQRIWTHPYVMRMNAKKIELANEKKRLDATDSEGSLRDFIDDGTDSATSDSSDVRSISGSDDDTSKKPKRGTRANPVVEEPISSPVIADKIEESTNDDVEWWTQFVKDNDYEDMRISSKLLLLFRILKESHSVGDKVLVFSQSLYSLTLIEEFLRMIDDETQHGNDEPENLDKHTGSWSLGLDYFRLDGQSSTDNRRRWCDIFNRPTNTRARLFLISTRAGGLGINLTAANRVIIFDASWNPSHDVQSIFRIYRFGQKKPCYVYRLLAAGTMEEKIYNRQVTKLSLSCRVVDEQQIERHYSNNALAELYKLEISETETTLNLPKDRLLAEIFLEYKHCVENYHEHDSLLENQAGEELDEDERQQAWLEYEEEKKGKRLMPPNPFMNYQNEILMQQTNLINMAQQNPAIVQNPAMMLDYENIRQMMSRDYPGASEAQQKAMATRVVYEMYNYVERQAMNNQNPLGMMNMTGGQLGFDNRMGQQTAVASHPTADMMALYQQSLAQQQNGQVNYPINHGVMGDSSGHARNASITPTAQLPSQSSSVVDDDVVEISSSAEKNLVPPPPAPGGSRKSQEE